MKKLFSILCILSLLTALFPGCAMTGTIPASPVETTRTEAPAPETAAPGTDIPAPETDVPAPETDVSAPETDVSAPETDVPAPETVVPAPQSDSDVHPMLFRVTGPDGQEMYLFGTIHVGDKRTGTALEAVVPWLDGCDALAVEFNIAAYEQDMAAQTRDMMSFLLIDGTTIEDHLDPELYERACDLLEQADLYPSLMQQFNTAMWSQLTEQAALITTCPDLAFDGGMDRQLIAHCESRGIEIRDVESAELQYGLLASFPEALNVLLIRETLDHLGTYSASTHRLYEAWLAGNSDNIRELVEGENEDGNYSPEELAMIEDYNYRMLDERNLGMRDRAVQWLEAGDKVFFAVGAAHLVGDAGLVTLLRNAGYTVEQILGDSAG